MRRVSVLIAMAPVGMTMPITHVQAASLAGWDDPHDFSLSSPPNQYEHDVARAGPWLTRNLADHVNPTIDLVSPAADATIGGTTDVTFDASDDVARDAVMLLLDDRFVGIDRTAPFSIPLETTKLPVGDHRLVGVAFDTTGNFTETSPATVHVENEIHDGACNATFPLNTFRACFYDGNDTTAPYLGSWYDGVFPRPAANVAWGPSHEWGDVGAFGRADHITGVWRGGSTSRRVCTGSSSIPTTASRCGSTGTS